jgi:outer membrane protein
MIRKIIMLLALVTGTGFSLAAQEPWSLEKCIQYAMENNILIKQSVLNTEVNENLLKQSKLGQIPTLNGSGNYNYSWGRVLDQTTYRYSDNQSINSINLGINSQANLFSGLRVRNTIQQNELNLLASYEDVERVRNDISLNIAAAYLNIMFNKELLSVTQNQLEITGQQVERTSKMVEAGNWPGATCWNFRPSMLLKNLTWSMRRISWPSPCWACNRFWTCPSIRLSMWSSPSWPIPMQIR